MTTLVMTFPLGRYHATPWDRHVNEGAVELPPSPWRLLRALYAVWRYRCPDLPGDVVHPLLEDLARPPTFHIPAHRIAHTRHYYPDAESGKDRVLDAFAVWGAEDQLAVQWPMSLAPDKRDALRRVAASLPYFGRADSICLAAVEDDWTPSRHEVWKPLDVAERVDGYDRVTSVLAPELPLITDTLLVSPAEVRRDGLRFPVGSRLVAYGLDATAAPLLHEVRSRPHSPVTAVRFSLLGSAAPPDTDAVVYTDLLRQAAIRQLGETAHGTMLGGRTSDNEPMRGGRHAHYLPIVTRRRITALVVWVPGSLPDKELAALCEVRALYDYKRRVDVRVSGIGSAAAIAPELFGPAETWRSATPFAPSRYPKKNRDHWRHFVETEIQRELRVRGRNGPVQVEFTDRPWTTFIRYRPSARQRGDARQGQAQLPSQFVRLHFAEPTPGPLVLGRLSHFGLGLFVPER
ncbi:type I-U CRISPR-associated protein Csb2 [Mycobacterium sp. MYCO198283]|uniref:type I-G CRISPR-associated protein Csb2 n=1 Tax=Mycobacterium sp. MYCO198283 TaxID=2883505 RepID=UPI001E5B14AB|nr:type I-U CRISPR-associated protein Csb2 [Mycobacterium sp. MYCO198283]MCG5432771.1 type I-U CRISPR-associated protein Csb2 [Mycobacterium sp. MYCO198283]